MNIGKLPNDVLQKMILDRIRYKRPEVLIRPKVGEDCCALDLGENVCVLSGDPVTGAVNGIGKLAVHVSCNDIASAGIEPVGLVVTILAPPVATEEELACIMGDICDTAASLNVDILGGHTEVTPAVNRFVINCTAVGKAPKGKLVTTSGARPGDDVVMTKTAGLEGTAIIAADMEQELSGRFQQKMIERAKNFSESISVVKEGMIAGSFGVTAMHDATEGGVLGAAWEIAEAADCGIEIMEEQIPVAPETAEICNFYGINPLKLISSGSMIMTCREGAGLVKTLGAAGIHAAVIGKITAGNTRVIIGRDGHTEVLMQPEADELYKVVHRD